MKLQATLCFLLQLLFEPSFCTPLIVTTGSSLELPCLTALPEFTTAPKRWTFNGIHISSDVSGPVRIRKDGLFLFISPITGAHQGQYVCSVNESSMDILQTYDITVTASFVYEIKAVQGSTIYLPCNIPQTSQLLAKALWYKETGAGQRTYFREDASGELERLQQLNPLDYDQSALIRNLVTEDSGIYHCESPKGEKLSTVRVTVTAAPTAAPYSCADFSGEVKPCLDQDAQIAEIILQESLAEFSMKLYSSLRESQPSKNLLVSPLSISALLSHLLLGARDKTQRALESALSLPQEFSCVHFLMKKLREKLATSLQMSSQIYHHPEMTLSESFANRSVEFYEAVPTKLLETSEENTDMINSWVANKTNNKIQRLVDSVSPSTQLMLLNAVSFKGQWKLKFNLKPRKNFFRKLNGDLVSVPVLYHAHYPLTMILDPDLKALVAGFALTGETTLYVLLPASNTLADFQQVEERLTDAALLRMTNTMKTMAPQKAEVLLPKLQLDVEPDMSVLMRKLGLSGLFEDANLCGLYSEDRLLLDEVRHRGFLALSEQGVEAAAATSVAFSRTFNSFSALQPFVFLLWSEQANVPLFVGRVIEP